MKFLDILDEILAYKDIAAGAIEGIMAAIQFLADRDQNLTEEERAAVSAKIKADVATKRDKLDKLIAEAQAREAART